MAGRIGDLTPPSSAPPGPRVVAAANHLTARWARTLPGTGSTALSGAAVWPLLGFLAGSADLSGRRELTAALGLAPEDDVAACARVLVHELRSAGGVRSALAVWCRSGVPLADWWRENVPDAETRRFTGIPEVDAEAAREWVRKATAGLVEDVSVPWAASSLLVLIGALTVQCTWRRPFTPGRLVPRSGPWGGRKLDGLARTTRDLDAVAVAETPTGTLTVLTVATGTQVLVHLVAGPQQAGPADVLPAAVRALADRTSWRQGRHLQPGVAAPQLEVRAAARWERPGLSVELPAFTCAASHDLLRSPRLFGLDGVSSPDRGHFPGLSPVPLAVSGAGQDVQAAFTATGFSVSVTSRIELSVTSAPPSSDGLRISLRLDRPFAFIAEAASSGLVLACGWVGDVGPPSVPTLR